MTLDPTPPPADCGADLLALLARLGDPSWAYRQYDHQLFLNTVVAPGADAAVLRLKAPGLPATERGVALSVDGNGRWCAVDPRAGTAMLVAEATLNVACGGGRPIAVVNCLNFGNPEHPEVMWELAEAIDGMGDACRALHLPVIGGNVSLYNESRGADIDPTPVIGVLGLVDSVERPLPGVGLVEGSDVLLLGDPHAQGLGGSLWAAHHGRRGGPLPALDLELHARLLDLVRGLVTDRLVTAVHDVSEGGLGVALAEMALASGVGCVIEGIAGHAPLFSEAPSRVVVTTEPAARAQVDERATTAGVPSTVLGRAGGERLVVAGLVDVGVAEARARTSTH